MRAKPANTAKLTATNAKTANTAAIVKQAVAVTSSKSGKKRQRSQETCRCGAYFFPHRKAIQCENYIDSMPNSTRSRESDESYFGVASLFKHNERFP